MMSFYNFDIAADNGIGSWVYVYDAEIIKKISIHHLLNNRLNWT